MSFGSKPYQHRFYTTPKMRDRHISDFVTQQPHSHHYSSVSAFSPYQSPFPQPNFNIHSPVPEHSMKQSYIRLINNGMNSRLYTKDELGYEGVKFEKDVINRYCSDDYRKNTQILEKFKKQAEESKRSQKYRHLRENSSGIQYGFGSQSNHYNKISTVQSPNMHKNSISLLPITNSRQHHRSISSPEKVLSIKNTQNLIIPSYHSMNVNQLPYHTIKNVNQLPSLRVQNKSSFHRQSFGSIDEEQSHNQNQDLDSENVTRQIKFNHSVVRDVGINAHLSAQEKNNNRKSQQFLKDNQKPSYNRKKSESLRMQTMKLRNKSMKKKYDKLKRQLKEKSALLSHHQQLEEQKVEMEDKKTHKQNFKNLQLMIHDLCTKLRANNSTIQLSRQKLSGINGSEDCARAGSRYMDEAGRVTQIRNQMQHETHNQDTPQNTYNQTQINTLKQSRMDKSRRINQLLKKQQMAESIASYEKQLQKMESYRSGRPKIVYSVNNKEKIIKLDGLRLLKNRIQEKHFHLNVLGDCSKKKYRSKTQQCN